MKYKWLPKNLSVKKVNEDTWNVYWKGTKIHEVYKGWTRHGGAGYTYAGCIYTYKTLKEAVLDLVPLTD